MLPVAAVWNNRFGQKAAATQMAPPLKVGR